MGKGKTLITEPLMLESTGQQILQELKALNGSFPALVAQVQQNADDIQVLQGAAYAVTGISELDGKLHAVYDPENNNEES